MQGPMVTVVRRDEVPQHTTVTEVMFIAVVAKF